MVVVFRDQQRLWSLQPQDFERSLPYADRKARQPRARLPLLPTTTIGALPRCPTTTTSSAGDDKVGGRRREGGREGAKACLPACLLTHPWLPACLACLWHSLTYSLTQWLACLWGWVPSSSSSGRVWSGGGGACLDRGGRAPAGGGGARPARTRGRREARHGGSACDARERRKGGGKALLSVAGWLTWLAVCCIG